VGGSIGRGEPMLIPPNAPTHPMDALPSQCSTPPNSPTHPMDAHPSQCSHPSHALPSQCSTPPNAPTLPMLSPPNVPLSQCSTLEHRRGRALVSIIFPFFHCYFFLFPIVFFTCSSIRREGGKRKDNYDTIFHRQNYCYPSFLIMFKFFIHHKIEDSE